MNRKLRRTHFSRASASGWAGWMLAAAWLLPGVALAQSVAAPAAQPYERRTATAPLTTVETAPIAAGQGMHDEETVQAAAQWRSAGEPPLPLPDEGQELGAATPIAQEYSPMPRRFRYELSLDLRGIYDDNIAISGTNRRGDYYAAIAPQLVLGVGDIDGRQENFILLNYAPTGLIFAENSQYNTIDQVARLEGQYRIARVVLGLSQHLQLVQAANLSVGDYQGGFHNQTNLDVGGRRQVNYYTTTLSASAPLAGKTSVQLGGNYTISAPEDLIGSENLSGSIGVNYAFRPKISTGLHFTAGKNLVDAPSPDQTFQQLNVRANYEITGKMRANGSVGVEWRQSDVGTYDHVSPVFQLGINYAPLDGTALNLSATRRTLNSATAAAQDFTSTQVVLSGQQRFLQRVFLNLSAGLQDQTYFSVLSGRRTARDDNYYFIATGIDVRLTRFWFAGAFYNYRENDSSQDAFDFKGNQYGVRTTFRF